MQHNGREQIDNLAQTTITLGQKIKETIDILTETACTEDKAPGEEQMLRKLSEINEMIDDGPTPEQLNNITLNIDCCDFFWAIMDRIKNRASWLQKSLTRIKNMEKKAIREKLVKQDYDANFDRIKIEEAKLDRIVDLEAKNTLQDSKAYECLQNEKPTSSFLNAFKNCRSEESQNM